MSLAKTKTKMPFLHKRSDLHLGRKAWHLLTGLIFTAMYYLDGRHSLYYWGCVAAVIGISGFLFDLFRLRNPTVNAFVMRLLSPLFRESEKKTISGLPYYALGCSLSIFLFEEKIAILAILFLIFSDPICSLVGLLYGKKKILPNKTLAGLLAGISTCSLLSYLFIFWQQESAQVNSLRVISFCFLAGIIGGLAELFNIIDDNLTIPVLSGFGLTILNHFFGIL